MLSLGPRLKWFGDITDIPLPYALLGRLPVFDAALPARLALVVTPVVGLLLAWTIAAPDRRAARVRHAAAAAWRRWRGRRVRGRAAAAACPSR